MTFEHLLQGAEILSQSGNASISGIEYDSRRVKPGDAFVAMRGESSDGNNFIDKAISEGAVAVITDSASEKPRNGVAWAQVPHGRRALARLSTNFYKRPAERLTSTGITGTNGKSTTAFLIESILNAAGRKCALVGTIEYDVAVFSNLTRDHLDYHGTMDQYFASKQILFEGCGTEAPRAAVINIDDEYGRKLEKISRKRSSETFTYGLANGDFHAEKVEMTSRGTRLDLITSGGTIPLFSLLIGKVNVYNILAAAGAAYARNCPQQAIARGVESLARIPGRFERVDCKQPFT